MATIKLKYKGKWVLADDLPWLRDQDRARAAKPPPAVDVAALPPPEELDADVPLQQLFFEHEEVRHYITAKGTLRSGLTEQQQKVGQEILDRYRKRP